MNNSGILRPAFSYVNMQHGPQNGCPFRKGFSSDGFLGPMLIWTIRAPHHPIRAPHHPIPAPTGSSLRRSAPASSTSAKRAIGKPQMRPSRAKRLKSLMHRVHTHAIYKYMCVCVRMCVRVYICRKYVKGKKWAKDMTKMHPGALQDDASIWASDNPPHR